MRFNEALKVFNWASPKFNIKYLKCTHQLNEPKFILKMARSTFVDAVKSCERESKMCLTCGVINDIF